MNLDEQSLWEHGFAAAGPVLDADQCAALIRSYANPALFRSRIDMARYRFGLGDYQYFADPLPPAVADLRERFYALLAPLAGRWMEALGLPQRYPADLAGFRAHCHAHGQTKPTPLLLHYEAGGYNCLHQDLYGDIVFPFQVVICLSRPGHDFTGGEFLLVEQRPRAQSVGHSLSLRHGEALVFSTRYRPARGSRGFYRASLKHGVSRVLSGARYTLGVIFHDAPNPEARPAGRA